MYVLYLTIDWLNNTIKIISNTAKSSVPIMNCLYYTSYEKSKNQKIIIFNKILKPLNHFPPTWEQEAVSVLGATVFSTHDEIFLFRHTNHACSRSQSFDDSFCAPS